MSSESRDISYLDCEKSQIQISSSKQTNKFQNPKLPDGAPQPRLPQTSNIHCFVIPSCFVIAVNTDCPIYRSPFADHQSQASYSGIVIKKQGAFLRREPEPPTKVSRARPPIPAQAPTSCTSALRATAVAAP